ncbi:MAG: hypothetical protein AAF902_26360 [Chloroflexota bacterium]
MGRSWKDLIPNFDQSSYWAGVTSAFAEVVGAGVKQLALSHPYTKEDLEIMLEPSKQIAAEYGVLTLVEDDLLVTPLFPADVAQGKFVILFAQNQTVLNEYLALKGSSQTPVEKAWAFGRLLSYDNESIRRLISS